ncbi:hypothetical protein WCLP8_4040004 [uncultured Gammaproteobacteria bacterium]
MRAIGDLLSADRSLGGAVEWLAWDAPLSEDLPVTGGSPIKAATVVVTLSYSTGDPLN